MTFYWQGDNQRLIPFPAQMNNSHCCFGHQKGYVHDNFSVNIWAETPRQSLHGHAIMWNSVQSAKPWLVSTVKRVVCNILPLPSVFRCMLQQSYGVIYISGVWRGEKKSLESSFKSGRNTACLHPFIINETAVLSIFLIILNTLKT